MSQGRNCVVALAECMEKINALLTSGRNLKQVAQVHIKALV